jgi:hypothetical protein
VPWSACDREHSKIDLESLEQDGRFRPLYSGGWGPMERKAYSVLKYSTTPDRNHITSLVEVFESGVIEAIKVLSYDPLNKRINIKYEQDIVNQLPEYLSLLEHHSIQSPLYIAISFLEIKDWSISLGPNYGYFAPVEENEILTKCKILENFDDVGTPDQAYVRCLLEGGSLAGIETF